MKQIILTLGILVIFSNMAIQYSFSYPPRIQEVTDGCTYSLREGNGVEPTQLEVESCVIMYYQEMNSPNKLSANSTYSEVVEKCTQILRDFIQAEPPEFEVNTCVNGTLEDLRK